jgi:hypothetical protein
MSIGKKIRFRILARDNFTCQYCGARAPEATLEVDHIVPRSRGGKNSPENLRTACFSCNRGKSDISLGYKLTEEDYRILRLLEHAHFSAALDELAADEWGAGEEFDREEEARHHAEYIAHLEMQEA